jgi:hypothetical protein
VQRDAEQRAQAHAEVAANWSRLDQTQPGSFRRPAWRVFGRGNCSGCVSTSEKPYRKGWIRASLLSGSFLLGLILLFRWYCRQELALRRQELEDSYQTRSQALQRKEQQLEAETNVRKAQLEVRQGQP